MGELLLWLDLAPPAADSAPESPVTIAMGSERISLIWLSLRRTMADGEVGEEQFWICDPEC